MKPKTILKIVGGIVGTILLGAIGSGFWERLLAPGLDWIFRTSVQLINSVSLNYKNGIYEAAAKGFHEDYSHRVFLIGILLLSFFMSIYAARKHEKMNDRFLQRYLRHKEFFQNLAVLLTFAFIVMSFYSVGRHGAINQITTYSIQSLNILRPFVGEKKYLLLKSEFFLIRSFDQFADFNSLIIREANANNLNLPVYEPL